MKKPFNNSLEQNICGQWQWKFVAAQGTYVYMQHQVFCGRWKCLICREKLIKIWLERITIVFPQSRLYMGYPTKAKRQINRWLDKKKITLWFKLSISNKILLITDKPIPGSKRTRKDTIFRKIKKSLRKVYQSRTVQISYSSKFKEKWGGCCCPYIK